MKKLYLIFIFLGWFFYLNTQTSVSTGTGFFVNNNGVIITSAHVIEDASRVIVNINDKEYTARVIAVNNNSDLAVLQVDYRNNYHFRLTNFDNVNLGDKVFVLGFPLSSILGSDIRLTDGIVSARSGIERDQTYFQISAPIQPGNSGGPIFTENFEVIGVAAHKLNDMSTFASSGVIPQNVNFGVKSDFVRTISSNIFFGNGNINSIDNAIQATVQLFTSVSAQKGGSYVTIKNNTGYTIWYIYVSPSSSTSWGVDLLGSSVLMNGRTARVPLPQNNNNQFDIRLVDNEQDSYTRYNVRLVANQTVEFKISDLD